MCNKNSSFHCFRVVCMRMRVTRMGVVHNTFLACNRKRTKFINCACEGTESTVCPESKKLYPGDCRLFYKCVPLYASAPASVWIPARCTAGMVSHIHNKLIHPLYLIILFHTIYTSFSYLIAATRYRLLKAIC